MSSAKKILIELSKHCPQEQRYVIDWVMKEVFGLGVGYQTSCQDGLISLSFAGTEAKIELPDSFFKLADKHWLQPESIPPRKLSHVEVPADVRGNILGENVVTFIKAGESWNPRRSDVLSFSSNGTCEIPFDLFGSLFFLISRYEEAVLVDKDKYDRFPSSASLTGNSGLLEKAIGNEYIELLWNCLVKLWPALKRTQRSFRLLPSHDIDHPSYFWNQTNSTVVKKCLGDIVRRGDISRSINRFRNWRRYSSGISFVDPFDQCDWLMSQSEKHNLRSAFYYIPIKTHANDPGMPIADRQIVDQWERIAQRGHELGYHPGFDTFDSAEAIQQGADAIRGQLKELNIEQPELGGRQHVLRWETSATARYLDAAGMDYDSTLGYADLAGFRCGVCYEFPMYDLQHRRQLAIRQRPLIAMDVTVTNARYMNLGLTPAAFDCFVALKRECQKYSGDFSLLWHNTELLTNQQRDFYASLLAA